MSRPLSLHRFLPGALLALAAALPLLLAAPRYAVLVGINDGAKQSPSLQADYSTEPVLLVMKGSGSKPGDGGKVKGDGKVVALDLGGKVKMEFVRIPAGKFLMGSPEDEKERDKDEMRHEVEITRPFYLGKYEVTQEQYEQVMGKNPSWISSQGGGKKKVDGQDTRQFPVEMVSWDDAKEFCGKLAKRSGRGVRLPSEAEWEYACRAGTTTPFHFGSSLNGDKANCDGNFPYGRNEKGPYLERTCRVGSYVANAFGLFDMHGNVWEWCEDRYGENYYANSPKRDPQGINDGPARVLRGGDWDTFSRNCRSACRYRHAPANRFHSVGFRVAFRLD